MQKPTGSAGHGSGEPATQPADTAAPTPPSPKQDPRYLDRSWYLKPHQLLAPEDRVRELAHSEPGLTDKEVLKRVGFGPYTEGSFVRRELLTAYYASEPVRRWTDDLKSHAMDWASSVMHCDYDTAEAYGHHMVHMHRMGQIAARTSYETEYPVWLAEYEAEDELEL